MALQTAQSASVSTLHTGVSLALELLVKLTDGRHNIRGLVRDLLKYRSEKVLNHPISNTAK